MNGIERIINSIPAAPSSIIHLGAGTCSEHETYMAIRSDQIIYVEPNQHLAKSASDAFSKTPHVKVVPNAIATENGHQTLNITNNLRFSSLLVPAELLEFYPNIKVDEQAEVETITLTKLCQQEGVRSDSDNLLVAELQGLEEEVFLSTEIETLQKFKWMIIRSSVKSLYTLVTGNTQINLSEALEEAGFIVLTFEEDAPPFVNLLCVRNDAEIDNTGLKAQQTVLSDTIKGLEHNLSKQRAGLDDLKTSHATALTELQLSMTSRTEELNNAQALIQSITSEKENQQQQLNEFLKAIETKSEESALAQTQIQSLTAEKENLHQQIKETANAVDAKSEELTQAQTQIQSLTAEKEKLLQQIKETASTVNAKSEELTLAQTQIQSLTAEKEKLLQQIKETASTVNAKSEELTLAQTQIQSLTAEKVSLQQQINQTTSVVDAKSDELNQAQTRIQALTAEKESHLQQIIELANSIKVKETELTETQQTVRINSKLLLKSDTDLKDLQLQYRAALQQQTKQHTLLSELKEKLREASDFYQKLNLRNLVIDSDMPVKDNSNDE